MKVTQYLLVLALAVVSLSAAGCDDDDDQQVGDNLNREYIQIERLGNPLVSEVMFAKRNHPFHNATGPSTDVANFKTELEAFVTGFGRKPVVATTLSSVLLPDELVVDTSKSGTTAGWLSWALAQGFGGRKLTDDVVDAGLAAIFGNLLDPDNTIPGLTTDNVGENDKDFDTTFPYLATPH